MKTRLEEHYYKNIHPIMIDKFKYKNKFEIPKLTKVVINIGVEKLLKIQKIDAIKEISAISGQKPIITRAKSYCYFQTKRGHAFIGVKDPKKITDV